VRRSFFSAYTLGESRALELLPPGFTDPQSRVQRARQASGRGISPELATALGELDRTLPPSPVRTAALAELSVPGTVAVVTGQQMGLFLGPLYTFYKAATAIVCARALARESGLRCVPVFWLQTEDHDFPEIGHCHLPERVAISDCGIDPHVSAAHRHLGQDVAAAIDVLEERLGPGETVDLLRAHYRPGRTLVQAFADLLAAVFADQPLVLVDPRRPAIARLCAAVHRYAIAEAGALEAALAARGRKLHEAGFEEQVHLRPGVALSFVHARGPEGPRERLPPAADQLAALDRDPLSCSSSALLRPIVQDRLLPTAVYVGGPAELSYFTQVAALYPLFDLAPPVVAPRARFRLIEPRVRSLLEQLGLAPADAERPRDELVRRLAGRGAFPIEPWQERLLGEVDRALGELDGAGVDVGDARHRTRETIAHALSRLSGRVARALSERDGVTAARLDRLLEKLAPGGEPQERHLSLWPFASRYGLHTIKERVLAAIVPWDATIREIEL
jgi:bacillithiol biosynthesis cysteine-adding enzyme BshC